MTRTMMIVLALVAAQGIAVLVWLSIEPGSSEHDAGTRFEADRMAPVPAPELSFESPDGTRSALAEVIRDGGRPVLVHFWASWCGPCREELPRVLALEVEGLEVLAVSVDTAWPAIRLFTGDPPPRRVVRALRADVARAFGVDVLPESLLVSSTGVIVERYRGPRIWDEAAARYLGRALGELGAEARP